MQTVAHSRVLMAINISSLESLRLGPVIVNLIKVAREDYKYKGNDGKEWLIEKGTVVDLPVYCIQRDPLVYKNPNEFNPDRFDPETGVSSKEYKQRCSLIPFGEGPRQCLGNNTTSLETYFVLLPHPNPIIPLHLA